MSKCRGFFTVTYEHLHLPGLNTCQIMLLSRMSSFGVFFEAPKNTARFLNYAEKTLQTAKQALLRAGYIFELENTGRGKKYLVRADLRQHALSSKDLKTIEKIKEKASANGKPLNIPPHFLDKNDALKKFQIYGEEPQEEMEEQAPASPLRSSSGLDKEVARMSKFDKEVRSATKWRKAHPDLIPIFEEAEQYLKRHNIPILDYPSFRRGLTMTAKALMDPNYPTQHIRLLHEYFAYLESPEYLYQVAHNKFTPQVVDQYDLWQKVNAVRVFAGNPDRHYDPSKVLTH